MQEEAKLIQGLLSKKKLVLLLDIDNTILHACGLPYPKDELEKLKGIYNENIGEIRIGRQNMIFKLRPFVKEFFESIRDKYEIYLYTYGTKDYAIEVLKYINKVFNAEYLSEDRLVARDNNESFSHKTIKRIFPSHEEMVLILDDRTDVWNRAKNLINISAYNFFNDRAHKLEYFQNDSDSSLYPIQKLLTFIHSAFYHIYDNKQVIKDVKIILEHKLKSIFKGTSFILSGKWKYRENVFEIYSSVIETFGGKLMIDYDDEKVDVVITNRYDGKNLLNRYK